MDSSFDPFDQSATFHDRNGNPFEISIAMINDVVSYNTNVSINYGAQLGASVVALCMVGLLTTPEKRRTIVFSLNVAALLCSVIRMLCMSIYFTTNFSEAYRLFAWDFSDIAPGVYANSILGIVMTTVLLMCVELSLLVQTQAICTTMKRVHQSAILSVSIIVVFLTVAFRFVWMVENCKTVMANEGSDRFIWLQSTNNIVIMVSVCYFSAIFMTKLGYTIYARKKLGITNFGPMQVIFIMSCQTLIVPAILAIATYFVNEFELNQNVLTLMAISLPLTSIWASAAVRHHHETATSHPDTQRRRLWDSVLGTGIEKPKYPNMSTNTTLIPTDLERGGSVSDGLVYAQKGYSVSS